MVDVNLIDWNDAWKKPDGEEGKKKGFISCGRRWTDPDRCRRFSEAMKEGNWAGSRARISAMDIRENFRILDVGPGPGTLAIPLANIAAHVTAVEPSEGMLACLRENVSYAGVPNIDIVPKKWEEVDIKQDLRVSTITQCPGEKFQQRNLNRSGDNRYENGKKNCEAGNSKYQRNSNCIHTTCKQTDQYIFN